MKRKLIYPAIGLAVGILVWLSYYAGLFAGLENFFEDILFTSKPVSGDIVIVAIDDESIQRVGQWPWPREVFARALRNLENARPVSVGLDVIFALPSSVSITEPLVIMFLLMKCLLAGLSVIVFILACLKDFVFGSNKFAVSALSILRFLLAPIVLIT